MEKENTFYIFSNTCSLLTIRFDLEMDRCSHEMLSYQKVIVFVIVLLSFWSLTMSTEIWALVVLHTDHVPQQ